MPDQIILIRHGESEKDKNNPLRQLTENGKKQIANAGAVLKNLMDTPDAEIISTTAPRAVQSAQILAQKLGVPFKKRFANLRVENIELISANPDNLTFKYFSAFEAGVLPKRVPSPRAIVRRFLKAVDTSNARILIIVGHSGALESFANYQDLFSPDKRLKRELRYGEFVVLTRQKC